MSKTVLIIDDVGFDRTIISALLRQSGYDVIGEASNGVDGVEKAMELQPDIILNNRGTGIMADVILTPESMIPRTAPTGYWETCMGLAGRGGWIPPEYSEHKELQGGYSCCNNCLLCNNYNGD